MYPDPGGPTDPVPQLWRIVIIIFQILWIRIRIDFGSPGSGSVLEMQIQIQEQENRPRYTNNLPFKKVFVLTLVHMFCDFLPTSRTQIQILVTAKSDQDQDPHGSALAWLPGSRSALGEKAMSGSALR
jgi:hypothetical protein